MANCKCKEFLESVTFECDWKDLGLMGVCAGSLGALVGMLVPEKYKNAAAFGAGAGFFMSAIAVTVKSIAAAREDEFDEYEDYISLLGSRCRPCVMWDGSCSEPGSDSRG